MGTAEVITESEKKWSDMSEHEIKACLAAHAAPLRLDWKNSKHMACLKRIFDLASPTIVLVYKNGRLESCRVHEDSTNVVKVLIRQYL